MTQMYEPLRNPSRVASERWTGWVVFGGIMLAITGSINLVQGLAALFKDGYFLVRSGDDLLVADFTAWGVVMLVWGGLLVGTGMALMAGRGWARWAAIVLACLSVIVQIGFLAAYPIWSAIVIAFDVIVIYALTARWDEARPRL